MKKTLLVSAMLCLAATGAYAKTVNVGTNAEFAPFEFMDPATKEITGFDIDLIKAVIEVSGNKANIMNMGFDGLIPALRTKTIDVSASGMTITDARKKQVNFSDPYYQSGLSILIKKSDANKIKGLKDLEGKKICAQIGTTGSMKGKSVKGATVKDFNGTPEAFMELVNGGCDAVINDKPVIEEFLKKKQSDSVKLLPEVLDAEYYGFAVNKNDKKLLGQINAGLKKLKANGTYDKIYAKWFGQ
ncbi:MAG TPA: basic amino acid ABC transporter substrate-binding protein [Sutterella sp.]|nr:basic amino acid ABC transporter substrate-binding protein [Sutterella sp.]